MDDSNDIRQPLPQLETVDSAWERWELPFLAACVDSRLAGRTVSSVLNELQNMATSRSDSDHTGSSDEDKLNSPDHRDGSIEAACPTEDDQRCDAGQLKGFNEGYEQGLIEGRLKAQMEVEADFSAQKEVLRSVIAALCAYAASSDDLLVDRLCDLLKYMLNVIVPDALDNSSGRLRQFVQQAVDRLPSTNDTLSIKMHSNDVDILKGSLIDIPDGWEIAADPEVGRGAVWVASKDGYSALDVQEYIDQLWSEFKNVLISTRMTGAHGSPVENELASDQDLVPTENRRDSLDGE